MAGLISSSSLGKRKKSNQANKSQTFEIRDTLLPSCGLIPTLQCVTQLFSINGRIYVIHTILYIYYIYIISLQYLHVYVKLILKNNDCIF